MKGIWTLAVISVHLFVAGYLLHGAPPKRPPQRRHRICVQTVTLKPPPPKPKKVSTPRPLQKKPEAAKPVAKQTRKAKAPQRKPAAPRREGRSDKSKALLRAAREKLQALDRPKVTSPLPAKAIALAIDEPLQQNSSSDYAQKLAMALRLALVLPEHGPVTVLLTLSKGGSVKRVVVSKSMSEKNKAYVIEHLPTLRFEPLERSFPGEEEHTFTVNLMHEA